jgi:hypothetical protein
MPDDLERLRKKYADAKPGEIFNPAFRKVAEKTFDPKGTRRAPYMGVPTLLAARHRVLDLANPDLTDLDVALLGVPMDLGITNRPGSRFGPRALRTIERIGPYNHVLECAPLGEMRVADIGDVPFRTVIIHTTVLAADGRRMSKSLGTGIDRQIAEEEGAEAAGTEETDASSGDRGEVARP